MIHNLVKLYKIPLIKYVAYCFVKMGGVEIPLSVKIGTNFSLPHGAYGTVIHPYTVIKDNVKIYQNVTIGRGDIWKNMSEDFDGFEIGNNVCICAGAKIICSHGKRILGDNCVIGANAVVINDVPPDAIVAGIPAKVIKYRNNTNC